MMSFSDFPPPAELPNNMHHSEIMIYLRLYAQAFNLMQHIHLQVSEIFQRCLFVCLGVRLQPHLPLKDFPGIESFQGRYFHSWDYRSAEGLEGKRVVVIGMGNSGADIAVDISRVAEKVYLSTRSGAWVIGRVAPGGLPLDIVYVSRKDNLMQKLFPSWTSKMLEKKLNEPFDHKLYGLQPKHTFFAQIPVVNDDLPARIISGRVQVKPNVKEFSGSSVIFTDGSIIDKVDVVVFATGYNYGFPFLPAALQAKCGYRLCLYKHIFHPKLTKPTLAVVGFIHGFGAINPLAEMQARWATRVFKGKMPHRNKVCFVKTQQRCIRSKKKTVKLNYKAANVTKTAILTQWDRVIQPFKTRVVPEPETKPSSTLGIIMIFSCAALLSRNKCLAFQHYPAALLDRVKDQKSAQ
uniref:Flavin-containing monooxygenase n=1 Tax=Acanthochromis polyacanthus TaxID=80966 RepID=A0A3Q1EDA2_9TELE